MAESESELAKAKAERNEADEKIRELERKILENVSSDISLCMLVYSKTPA